MLIQDKQQEAAVDSALLGSQTNHGLTSHNGNFSTLCIHRTLIIPAGWPDQRSGWFIGCLSICIVWIAVLLHLSFGRRAAVVCCRAFVFTYWMPGKVIPEGAPVFFSVAVKHSFTSTDSDAGAAQRDGTVCCVFMWACPDGTPGWAVCRRFGLTLGQGLWGMNCCDSSFVYVHRGLGR